MKRNFENKRNPVAEQLRTSRFRKRVVRDKTKYTRKKKHKSNKVREYA